MHQLELKFFWPLQEQIALDLDYYKIASTPLIFTNLVSQGTGFTISGATTINVDQVVFRTKRQQSLFQRLFFRLLGLRVENVDN
jgi:hypothetical protein